MPTALAFSNNDIAVLAWSFDVELKGCLGFAVYRGDVQAGTWEPLPALATFDGKPPPPNQTTEQSPIQKFWWKDLGARRGGLFRYRIVALGGAPGALAPLAGQVPLVTNVVSLTADRGVFSAYFNRGIVASQAVVKALGTPSAQRLKRHIADPKDPLRQQLSGQIQQALESLLDEADQKTGAEIRGALYELDDPQGLEKKLHGADQEAAARRAIVLGNARESEGTGATRKDVPDSDSQNRANLKAAGVNVVDRILPSGHIPHNKFLVLKDSGMPSKVLTGSTNWTTTGLCAQTNNALIIDSPAIAAQYAAYWDQLEKDTGQAEQDGKWQGPALRDWARAHNEQSQATPTVLEDNSATVEVKFAASTKSVLNSKNPVEPGDMARLFELMADAKQAILFLAFDPGNNSILDAAGKALAANSKLFVRGALTSAERALNFAEALKSGAASAADPKTAKPNVGLVGEPGASSKLKGVPDFRAIPAGAVDKDDAFGAWEAELRTAGHAIIHDKIVVIDPFSPDCVVVTGSHNLGYRASSNNDENFVIVRGHRSLAEAYTCHVLDVYDHYAWRYWLHQDKTKFGRPLSSDDTWQARYLKDGKPTSAEMTFWLSSQSSVQAHEEATHATPVPVPKAPSTTLPPASGRRSRPSASRTAHKPAKKTTKVAKARGKRALG